MKKYLFLLILLYSCQKDLSISPNYLPQDPEPSHTCIALTIPNSQRKAAPTVQANYNGYSSTVAMYDVMDYQGYQDFGFSDSACIAWANFQFANRKTLYHNDSMRIYRSGLKILHQPDSIKGDILNFGKYVNDSLQGKGDLYTLLSRTYKSGGIAWIGGLCQEYQYRVGVTGIDLTKVQVPLYSWTAEVVSHEDGHLFNSPHSFACEWNGNNTAIDSSGPIAGYIEGICNALFHQKGTGYTIMSYGHLTSDGIDLSKGFGIQVADTMRSYIAKSKACLLNPNYTGCDITPLLATVTEVKKPAANGQGNDITLTATGGYTYSWSWTHSPIWSENHQSISIGSYTGNSTFTVIIHSSDPCYTDAMVTVQP